MWRNVLRPLAGEDDERVALAVALAVRALRGGSVCVDLRSVEAQVGVPDLPWPAADEWLAAVRASPLLGTPPVLRLYDDLLYLDRYWREEQQVADDLLGAAADAAVAGGAPMSVGCSPRDTKNSAQPPKSRYRKDSRCSPVDPGTGKTTTVAGFWRCSPNRRS